jgi:hypothetical protein
MGEMRRISGIVAHAPASPFSNGEALEGALPQNRLQNWGKKKNLDTRMLEDFTSSGTTPEYIYRGGVRIKQKGGELIRTSFFKLENKKKRRFKPIWRMVWRVKKKGEIVLSRRCSSI